MKKNCDRMVKCDGSGKWRKRFILRNYLVYIVRGERGRKAQF
jgi:hypothetical protein